MKAAAADLQQDSWYEASARQRLQALLDPESFCEFLNPTQRVNSPHLALFGLPAAFDDGMIVGGGKIQGRPVLVASQEGQFMGGSFGEVHGAKLVGLLRFARNHPKSPKLVLLLLDTGGVRLQEANAGELAVSEIIHALLEARQTGVVVFALVGGRAGAFGGGGIIAGSCSRIIVSEHGRIGVSGPEVIETNMGVEEFDSRDRPLVWRVTGGKTRRLLGGADAYVDDAAKSFRDAVLHLLSDIPPFELATLEQEHARLARRLSRFGQLRDTPEIWRAMEQSEAIGDLPDREFSRLAQTLTEANHGAR